MRTGPTKIDPTYDDLPEFRYHFPQTYRRVVEAAVGDWIIYYEPRRSTGDISSRGGRQAYFATARVSTVQPDPTLAGHFYAFVQDFLEFPRPVPFKDGERFYETALRRSDGNTSKGAFGRAVRPITDSEYGSILGAASAELLAPREPSTSLRFAGVRRRTCHIRASRCGTRYQSAVSRCGLFVGSASSLR